MLHRTKLVIKAQPEAALVKVLLRPCLLQEHHTSLSSEAELLYRTMECIRTLAAPGGPYGSGLLHFRRKICDENGSTMMHPAWLIINVWWMTMCACGCVFLCMCGGQVVVALLLFSGTIYT